jgi:hypothetical protein
MPDIDRTADVKVTAGWEPVTAEIPLAGHASERWLELFRMLAKSLGPGGPEVNDRDDRTWVIVRLPQAGPARNPDPESALNAASALIAQVNGMEQKSQSAAAQTEWLVGGATLLLYGIERGHVPPWGVACDLGRGGRI